MTTSVSAKSEAALFLHQMIPNHENAVNMAKTLLKLGELQCKTFDEENPDCVMYAMGLSIIASQNFQIQKMLSLLKSYGFPPSDDCFVPTTNRGLSQEAITEKRFQNTSSFNTLEGAQQKIKKSKL
jgi:hypothetical protein